MTNVFQSNKADIILNTYALAKASWLEDDFVSSFVPMVAHLINKKGYSTIDADIFASDFESEYGILLPSYPAIKLLSISQKKGLITFDESTRLWRPNLVSLSDFDLTPKKNFLQNGIEKVIAELINYGKDVLKENLNEDEAKKLLYSFIQTNSAKILNGEFSDYKSSFKNRNLVASFIFFLKESRAELFEIVKQITVGRLLVDALTMTEQEETNDDFKNSTVYIDTRFFLYLIGFYGEYRENASIDLIDKLISKKVQLYIFKHIYDEINYTLSGCAKWIDSPSYDPEKASSALRYLKSCGKDKKYVESLIASIPTKLKRFKITIDNDSWISDDYSLQIDRDELTSFIKDCYKNNDIIITDRVEETITYDVDSIEAIYYHRNGTETYNINEKNVFLLTTNRNLVFACKKYHNKNFTKNTIPATISDIFLGTFIWARSGIKCCENIASEKLIADCYSAMEPTQYAINKFCSHVLELQKRGQITDAEVIALKCYGLQTQAIKPFLSEPNEYDYKDLHDVLEEIRQKTIVTEKSKFDKEKSDLENQIAELTEKYGITEKEFIKYKAMAVKYAKEENDKQEAAVAELVSFATKAEDRLKIIPIVINATVNIAVQIALCFVSNSWISVPLRILVPVISLILGLALHFNWLNIKDAIKFRLIFMYKKKAENKKLSDNIKTFLSESSKQNPKK
ncbi:hypothetical protein [Ruminococcus sp.]|uniref:hypothetical protein n=1 Tax=Ruminococcus sp. TaxID=41978 RepID=UPI002611492B|nr:hypothetical protein [Ruminococcus sp.]MDD6988951.1 hypothetical protein [Ruminococcus sp.]MDY6201463.1 hypothetical protein [Ruminococcus sp.]